MPSDEEALPVRQPICEIERRVAERASERVAEIDRTRSGLQLDDEAGNRAASEPLLQQHGEDRDRYGGEEHTPASTSATG